MDAIEQLANQQDARGIRWCWECGGEDPYRAGYADALRAIRAGDPTALAAVGRRSQDMCCRVDDPLAADGCECLCHMLHD